MDERAVLTTYDVAQALSIDISTVIDWVDRERLPAYRTPGGHRRIKKNDLLSFLRSCRMPIPGVLARDGEVVLIVEDDGDFRRHLREVVGAGFPQARIEEADNGFLAGKKIEALKPDVVILDLFLPGIGGFEVCRDIRRDPGLKDTRVVAISGRATVANKRKILAAGADAFLSKPFRPDELRSAIKQVLEASVSSSRARA